MGKVFFLFALLVQGIFANPNLGLTPAERINGEKADDVVYPVFPDSMEAGNANSASCSGEDELSQTIIESERVIPQEKEQSENLSKEIEEDSFKTHVGLTPDEQIKKIQEASDRMSKVLQSEFESLAEMVLSSDKRSKRDVSDIIGNRYLTKLLKHIRENNEHQNSAIDKMMTAHEIAEKFGIDVTPDFESNHVLNPDMDVLASEPVELVRNDLVSLEEDQLASSEEQTITEHPEERITEGTTQSSEQNIESISYPPQYYYQTTPLYHAPAGSETYQTPDGSYYYYQVEAPVETNTDVPEGPTEALETTTSRPYETVYQQQPDQYQGYTPEQLSMEFVLQAPNQPQDHLVPEQEATYTVPSYPTIAPTTPQEQIIYVMSQPEEPRVTEEIQETMEAEATTEGGQQSRMTHISRSATYRFAYTSGGQHFHGTNVMPQQMQYYFKLA